MAGPSGRRPHRGRPERRDAGWREIIELPGTTLIPA
jgi:hypothetical protein